MSVHLTYMHIHNSFPPVQTSHSQTTTENEAEEEEEEEGGGEPVREREMGGYLPILQSLRAAMANTLSDEQEALGKVIYVPLIFSS